MSRYVIDRVSRSVSSQVIIDNREMCYQYSFINYDLSVSMVHVYGVSGWRSISY